MAESNELICGLRPTLTVDCKTRASFVRLQLGPAPGAAGVAAAAGAALASVLVSWNLLNTSAAPDSGARVSSLWPV